MTTVLVELLKLLWFILKSVHRCNSVLFVVITNSNNKLLLEDTPLSMPSTRKQTAEEKRSRQSDVMSDLESMNVMLGNYPGNRSDEELNENIEMDSRSNGTRTDMARNWEDFRSLLNTEDRIENEVTVDTSRFICTEISQQVSRKLDELKKRLKRSNYRVNKLSNSRNYTSFVAKIIFMSE